MAASTPGPSGRVDAWVHVCRQLFAADAGVADEDESGDE